MSASGSIHIVPIPLGLLPAMLPLAREHLAKGAAVSALDPEDVADDLAAGLAALWCIFDSGDLTGAFYTSVHDEPDGKTLHVYGLGGIGLRRWANELEERMLFHAAFNACRAVRFHGRPAWARVLTKFRPVGSEHGAAIYERAVA